MLGCSVGLPAFGSAIRSDGVPEVETFFNESTGETGEFRCAGSFDCETMVGALEGPQAESSKQKQKRESNLVGAVFIGQQNHSMPDNYIRLARPFNIKGRRLLFSREFLSAGDK
jgi:hypothetical protein